jgi:hypothetical protein
MRDVGTARIIIIADDDNVGATQVLRVFGAPFVRPAWVARRREPKLAQIVRVLLALHD